MSKMQPHPVLPEYYQDEQERRAKVDQMFDASASHYDWITGMMSFGSGNWYRKQALLRAGMQPGMQVLDVGAGTGAVSLLAQDIVGEQGEVIALDPSTGMLEEAKKRGVKNRLQGLGEDLPFPDQRFDMVTMSYALRHVADLQTLFAEYHRVLKPGGKVLLLEITKPAGKPTTLVLKAYMKGLVPLITRIFRRSADAQTLMRYYWDTIEACVPPQKILQAMTDAGLDKVERHLVMGIFSEYRGQAQKPIPVQKQPNDQASQQLKPEQPTPPEQQRLNL